MKENDFMIGGEQSGHIIFRKYAHTGDGLITALMLMQVMIDTQLPLSVLASGVSMYPQVLKNVRVDDKDGTLADADVQAAVDECTADLGDSGRVLLRKSGTEPVCGSWRKPAARRNVKSRWIISSRPWSAAAI